MSGMIGIWREESSLINYMVVVVVRIEAKKISVVLSIIIIYC